MALIKKTVAGITAGFTKLLADLDEVISDQDKRQVIAENNITKLDQLRSEQEFLISDAASEKNKARKVREKIAALIE